MIYRTFTDAELRRVIDNDNANPDANAEALRRFLLGSEDYNRLVEENERLASDLSSAEDRESEAWARVAELEGE